MTGVEWRPVPGYEGLYEVSSSGQVRRIHAHGAKRFRLLKPHARLNTVGLSKCGLTTSIRVGRLVAAAFLTLGEGRVYHANRDPSDNRVENLVIVQPGRCKLCGQPRTRHAEALCRACLNTTKLRLRRRRNGQDPDTPVRRGRTDKCLKCGEPRANLGKHARCRACYNAEQRMYARCRATERRTS